MNLPTNADSCLPDKVLSAISSEVGSAPAASAIKAKLDCRDDHCILAKTGRNHLGALYLKLRGPTSAELLSNINIDGVLAQWKVIWPKFFPYNFNMRNFASYSFGPDGVVHSPDTLATVGMDGLLAAGYNTAACVINTDIYQNAGLHWMALFVDCRRPKRWTVEFFNSSGNAPQPEFANWLVKTKNSLMTYIESGAAAPDCAVDIVRVTNKRHQASKSECGNYSLFYIWARLNDVPIEYFNKIVPDQVMFEFRNHIFYDPKVKQGVQFDWAEFSRKVNIKWEAGR
jgi:hypothetical protein